ncbi:DUF3304 domain-containing protein [Variovorax sp. S2]|uniref:DUF3304 domain-containing protein n=1 Tax=Variovorax sp. S12S4 TaxID=3029170 RepID=UPI00215D2F50|nr:DUF3304 domain-containing protein [Variovorax sp. S12S4]MCR8957846.1 DUF3304 domain-containing protein [Variovorax sp. S12S4]
MAASPPLSSWRCLALLFLVSALLLAGCKPEAPKKEEPVTVGITGYVFTDEGIQEYFVNDMYGSNLPPFGGGGKTSCCVNLPAKWSPDLRVKVDWITGHWTVPLDKIQAMDITEAMKCCLARRALSKTVSIEPYETDKMGSLQVFFLPDDQIKVWVSKYDLGHERHPSGMSYPEPPASAASSPASNKESPHGR